MVTSLDTARIRAITIDLDDTLWPVWPTIARAEAALAGWLATHAPATAALFGDAPALRAIRVRMNELRPDLRLDMDRPDDFRRLALLPISPDMDARAIVDVCGTACAKA